MADRLTAKLVGTAELKRALDRLDPSQQGQAMGKALVESASLVGRIASREKIKPGGTGKPKRGKLTSRTGTLRGSIAVGFVSFQGDISFITVGTDLIYGAVHENGGTFSVRSHSRKSRKSSGISRRFARSGTHNVKSHSRKVPRRSFMRPALAQGERKFVDIFLKHMRRAAKL